eukprot:jgi/Astpho2/8002/fgenesh1_pg.00120_%23_1_t
MQVNSLKTKVLGVASTATFTGPLMASSVTATGLINAGQGIVLPQGSVFTGSFNDLAEIPTVLGGDVTLSQLPTDIPATSIQGLAQVAYSGVYTDLLNTPALSAVAISGNFADVIGTPALASVALSGSYSDLSGSPVLKAVATSGLYSDLTGVPSLAPIAISGLYSDLTGTPTLAAVALSGNYVDLAGVSANFTTTNIAGSLTQTGSSNAVSLAGSITQTGTYNPVSLSGALTGASASFTTLSASGPSTLSDTTITGTLIQILWQFHDYISIWSINVGGFECKYSFLWKREYCKHNHCGDPDADRELQCCLPGWFSDRKLQSRVPGWIFDRRLCQLHNPISIRSLHIGFSERCKHNCGRQPDSDRQFQRRLLGRCSDGILCQLHDSISIWSTDCLKHNRSGNPYSDGKFQCCLHSRFL